MGFKMSKQNMLQMIREHKTLFVVIGVCLFLIELEIFALAAMKSGRKAVIQVLDPGGTVIYEADGANLSQFDKYYFEQNFGPLDRYDLRFVTSEVPFPFRAWFVAAIGIPVGGMLLFAFLIKAYLAVFHGETHARADTKPLTRHTEHSRLERLLLRVSRFNIFTIGFIVLTGVTGYWVVPNFVAYLSRIGIEALIRYKWVFLTLGVVFLGLTIWIIYLRFLLAKKSLDSRADLERYRLELEYKTGVPERRSLTDVSGAPNMVDWNPEARHPETAAQRDRPV